MTPSERQNWIDAMKAELNALVKNGTWKVSDESNKATNIFESKWVSEIKFDADGDVERFKQDLLLEGLARSTALVSRRHLHR